MTEPRDGDPVPGLQVEDMDGAEAVARRRWFAAYRAWCEGDREALAAWVADPCNEMNDDAREFFAALVRGEANPRPQGGAPEVRAPEHERRIACAVYAAWDAHKRAGRSREGSPKDRAIAEVCARYRMTEGQVRHVLAKTSGDGLTFDVWRRYMRR